MGPEGPTALGRSIFGVARSNFEVSETHYVRYLESVTIVLGAVALKGMRFHEACNGVSSIASFSFHGTPCRSNVDTARYTGIRKSIFVYIGGWGVRATAHPNLEIIFVLFVRACARAAGKSVKGHEVHI